MESPKQFYVLPDTPGAIICPFAGAYRRALKPMGAYATGRRRGLKRLLQSCRAGL